MKEFIELKKEFEVKDLINQETKIIFILESPHKDEIKYGVPVAGKAGATMTKVLFQEELPLGRYLNENWESDQYTQYGIMNVCNIPMQKAAYGKTGEKENYQTFFNAIEKIRVSTTKGLYKEQMMNEVQKYIQDNFQKRLDQWRNMNILIIPCGKFAEKYLRKAEISSKWKIIWDVPHPSYNSWKQKKYKEHIENLLLEIKNI